MAKEIVVSYPGTKSLYAIITQQSDAKVWSVANTAWEAYNASNIADYDIALSEDGLPNIYFADFPTSIASGTAVVISTFAQQGASPAVGDLEYLVKAEETIWTGTALSADAPSSTLTDRQKVRLNAFGDSTDTSYSDSEMDAFLDQANDDVFLATAYCLRATAADYAKCAIIAKDGEYSRDVRAVPRELNRQADKWEARSNEAPAYGIALAERPISSIDDVFRHNGELITE